MLSSLLEGVIRAHARNEILEGVIRAHARNEIYSLKEGVGYVCFRIY